MSKPTISLIHPSRSRPAQAAATAKAWLSSAKNPQDIEYMVSLDSSDPKLYMYTSIMSSDRSFCVQDNNNAIEAINNVACDASGDIFIVVSDDFSCPFHWDVALLEALEGKSDYLVKTKDGIQKTLITLPIMDRVYYTRFGYIYNPAYQHMFCDQEMTAVGHMLGRVIDVDITFKHNHYSIGGVVKDAINFKNDATWNQGQQVYNHRLLSGFGLKEDEIVNSYNSIVWH